MVVTSVKSTSGSRISQSWNTLGDDSALARKSNRRSGDRNGDDSDDDEVWASIRR